MNLKQDTDTILKNHFHQTYDTDISDNQIQWNETRKEFDGEFTLVVFPLVKIAKKKPEDLAAELGDILKDKIDYITDYNVVKGFLNLSLSPSYWHRQFVDLSQEERVKKLSQAEKIMVEYCSPNTNKPLHLGHIRNILLGDSIARVLDSVGHEVIRTQVVNDRGIAVCKSMLSWDKWAEGETPASAGMKGDHFVGKYYVLFDQKFNEEYLEWQSSHDGKLEFANRKKEDQTEAQFFKSYKNDYFNKYSKLGAEAKEMLMKWEAKDAATIELWKKMNDWVYEGFDVTFDELGVGFDKNYYESETYILGREVVEKGLKNDVFYKREDGSIWADLSDVKLDEKIVLRADGTSLYVTQDLGTAESRYKDYGIDRMIYVVGDEQEYHFQVLFEMLKRMNAPYADGLYNLAYGMVDLPDGKMKSREGNVVDADDLVKEVIAEARANSKERGELSDLTEEEQNEIFRKLGLAALKFFILKVNPRKRMTFDPKDSVDVQGQTGPYIQNAYVRIQSILRKADLDNIDYSGDISLSSDMGKSAIDMIRMRLNFNDIVHAAAKDYNPSFIADYCYQLAKTFHKYYHDVPILRTEDNQLKIFRLQLISEIAETLKTGMHLLGIEMPQRM